MGIRLSGMISGMDTESLVSALVCNYKIKSQDLTKAQTKVGWKQEKWKAMNTSIYSFYSGKLSSARFSASYNIKTASISNSSVAKITAGSTAVNGTQKLKVKQLATTGYLTGGEIGGADGNNLKADSKLSDIAGLSDLAGGSITLNTGKGNKTIEVKADTTINDFVKELKSAGLNASFDANNRRFFISSATSGAEGDFSFTADDEQGLKALKGLGLFTSNDTELNEYVKWASYSQDEIDAIKQKTIEEKKVTLENYIKKYENEYSTAIKNMESAAKSTDTWGDSLDTAKTNLDNMKAKLDDYALKDADGNYILDDEGNKKYDTENAEYKSLSADIKKLENAITKYETNKAAADKLVDDGFITVQTETDADGKTVSKGVAVEATVQSEVDAENARIASEVSDSIDSKVAFAKTMVTETTDEGGNKIYTMNGAASKGAVRITGQDSIIELNGAEFKSNTNTYSINGLTIQTTAETGDEAVTITTDTDVDGIYNMIKGFLKDYNDLIKSMDEAYNASSSKGYEPLTDEEKEAMSDDEVEKWETKIKDSLLRNDSTLNGVINSMKSNMMSSFEIDGKKYSLSSFGIATMGYFASGENETGVYHIDGDKEDSLTSGNSDKLRSMIASDPDKVISFFSQLSTKVYDDLGKRMASSSVSSAYTIYNDKEMSSQYSSYNSKISDAEDQLTTWEDYYYKKFSAMESALAKMQSQTSSLSGMFGSN
ncbi:MAG: flagellar filament capping protein FliD [Lachnospira sp.]